MAEERLKAWEILFARALELIDSTRAAGVVLEDWSLGGGTVLMRRHRHRFSKDIDIFVPDPQYLSYLTPRLNTKAESLTSNYVEQAGFLKLFFPEGEIDFVVSGPLTQTPTVTEFLLGREVHVETSTEIIGKKVWYRGETFTARDMFDLALIADKEPEALREIAPILQSRRTAILQRVETQRAALREAFEALETLEYHPTFDECVERIKETLR